MTGDRAGSDLSRKHHGFDAAAFLALLVLVVFLVPARAVVPGLGALGRPAYLLAAAALAWWCVSRLVRPMVIPGRQPVRWIIWIFLASAGASWVAAQFRILTPVESNAADRFMLLHLSLAGVALVCADGVGSYGRLRSLARVTVVGAAGSAVVGILQFAGFDLRPALIPPGLGLNSQLVQVAAREGTSIERVLGTATHYIEFGVVMAMVLPLAVHEAVFAVSVARARLYWSCAGLIGLAVPFAVSRSGTLAVVIAGLVVLAAWRWEWQRRGLLIGVGAAVLLQLAVPGLLGSLRGLFVNAPDDSSVTARTEDYDEVVTLLLERPLLGRGTGTFVPPEYRVLDNQYLFTVVTQGLVGVIVLIVLFWCAYRLARKVRFSAASEDQRHFGQCLASSFAVAAVSAVTFDAFSFGTYQVLLWLQLGMVGAAVRLRAHGHDAVHRDAVLRRRVEVV